MYMDIAIVKLYAGEPEAAIMLVPFIAATILMVKSAIIIREEE
jgi:hypothetical protein